MIDEIIGRYLREIIKNFFGPNFLLNYDLMKRFSIKVAISAFQLTYEIKNKTLKFNFKIENSKWFNSDRYQISWTIIQTIFELTETFFYKSAQNMSESLIWSSLQSEKKAFGGQKTTFFQASNSKALVWAIFLRIWTKNFPVLYQSPPPSTRHKTEIYQIFFYSIWRSFCTDENGPVKFKTQGLTLIMRFYFTFISIPFK